MPTFMVWARIVAKREHATNYYITFADATGEPREFEVNSHDYAQFAGGDTGRLSYDQFKRYVGFEPGETAFHLR
jgi:hypothetical protein